MLRWGISSRRSRSGGHVNADDAQPIEQDLRGTVLRDPLLEVGVGGRDDADVDARRARLADRHDLPLLEESQQLRLHVERQIADLVEKDRAADGGADHAGLVGHRAGEAAAPVAEQLAVGELAGRAGAVVGQEHRGAAGEPAWIARATRSLPVPLSPVISTVRSLPCSRWI